MVTYYLLPRYLLLVKTVEFRLTVTPINHYRFKNKYY